MKFVDEERGMRNWWWKHQQKSMNVGALKEDRVERFKELVEVGEKNFGENNGHVYARRYRPDYFEQMVEPLGGEPFLERNRRFREFYGERFIDMMEPVLTEDGLVRVFTPEHCFISADGKHLTQAGARFYAERIDWAKFLEYGNRQ